MNFISLSSRAEANFQLLFTLAVDDARETGRTHFFYPAGEDPTIVYPIQRLEKIGIRGRPLSLNSQGQLTRKTLQETLSPRTALLSLSWANEWTGVIHPLHDLIEVCRENQVKIHVDVTACKGSLDCTDLGVDYVTFDGGILSRTPLPIMTTSSAATKILAPEAHFEAARLRAFFEESIPAHIFFREAERLPHISAIAYPGVHHELLAFHLQRLGVHASAGRLAALLQASGVSPELAYSALTFDFSQKSEEEVLRLIDILRTTMKKMEPLIL